MAFYGNASDAESLAGTAPGTVTEAMQNFINTWIDDNIRMDGFVSKSATEFYDVSRKHQNELVLDRAPVISITQLQDGHNTPNLRTLAPGVDYVVDQEPAIIQLLSTHFTHGINSVMVQYTFGYESVPEDIKQIATMMAAKWAKIQANQSEADGLKQIKMGDYQETRDITFTTIKSEFDPMLDPLIERAKMKYFTGV